MDVLARLLRTHLRSKLRGATRATQLLAPRLKSVPIRFLDRGIVYMDLTWPAAAEYWLTGDPWDASPWEVAEQQVMRHYVGSGDVVFDIGAHCGLHTTLLSRLVGRHGRVFAFEPNPRMCHLLSLTLRPFNNVVLLPYAVAETNGELVLHVPDDPSRGSLRPVPGFDSKNVVCDVRRLDDLNLPQPSFIKIDVEGAELSTFKGARLILDREHAPIVLFEANTKALKAFNEGAHAPADFLLSLSSANYQITEVDRTETHSNLLAVPSKGN